MSVSEWRSLSQSRKQITRASDEPFFRTPKPPGYGACFGCIETVASNLPQVTQFVGGRTDYFIIFYQIFYFNFWDIYKRKEDKETKEVYLLSVPEQAWLFFSICMPSTHLPTSRSILSPSLPSQCPGGQSLPLRSPRVSCSLTSIWAYPREASCRSQKGKVLT